MTLQSDGIRFLTPDDDGSARVVSKSLALPSFLWSYVNGALTELMDPSEWYAFGNMSPDDVAYTFLVAIDAMRETAMLGCIVPYCSVTLPDGVLPCDGTTYYRSDYPALYDILPSALQTSESEFITPDLRDRFIVGQGQRPLLAIGGSNTHTLTLDEIPPHSHSYSGALDSVTTIAVPDAPSSVPMPMQTSQSGGGQAHNNLPPYATLLYGIVAR